MQRDLLFERASPFARPEVVLERVTSPLRGAAMRVRLDAARAGGGPDPWPALDLASERFELFVPDGSPPEAGLGLIVFVPPWEGQGLPATWLPVLQRHGLALVTAERSGNAQDVGVRRIPLALNAFENVRNRYRIDPKRVYVAGFSGGSRVALLVALAYPDVFRGALLNAGSDPIGTADVPLPAPGLFERFERDSRLVYLSGTRDAPAIASDRASRRSASDLCIADTSLLTIAGGGHDPAEARGFARALQELEAPRADAASGAACRQSRARRIAREMDEIAALVDAGKRESATRDLVGFDARWGGLAGEASHDMAARLSQPARKAAIDR